MRVLHVLSDDDRRGAQVFAGDLHRQLLALGHESRLSALQAGAVGGIDAAGPRTLALGSSWRRATPS